MLSIAIGPFSLPVPVLLLLTSVLLGLGAAGAVCRGKQQSATDALLLILLGALLIGRVAFVLRFADSYSNVWQMLDIRDRGIDPIATLVAVVVISALQLYRHAALKTAIVTGVATALLCYTAGNFWLKQQQQQQLLADIRLESLSGYSVALPELAQGKPVVINIWASWCPPCRREMPHLVQAEQQYPQIRFMLINLQESRTTVQQYLHQHQLGFSHVLLDIQGQVSRYYGAKGVPATLFFHADGRLSSVHFGEVSQAVLQHEISKLQ